MIKHDFTQTIIMKHYVFSRKRSHERVIFINLSKLIHKIIENKRFPYSFNFYTPNLNKDFLIWPLPLEIHVIGQFRYPSFRIWLKLVLVAHINQCVFQLKNKAYSHLRNFPFRIWTENILFGVHIELTKYFFKYFLVDRTKSVLLH